MIVIIGTVTDTEPSSYLGKDGKAVNQFNVWVSEGRRVLKTVGSETDNQYSVGDTVLLRIEPRSFANSSEVTAKRIERYPVDLLPDFKRLIGMEV